MEKAEPTRVHETFLAAGWSEHCAKWGVLRVESPDAAQKIVAAAAKLPEAIRTMVLKDARHTSDAALVAAFKEAAEISNVLNCCAQSAPLALRQIGNYVHRDADGGQRLMSAAEAREKLATALAEMDVHIDTSRPLSAADRGVIGSIAQAAEAHWVGRKGAK